MIDPYEFIDGNAEGLKERKLTATTELFNKLSAEETNNFRDKLNEVIEEVNGVAGLAPFDTFKFVQKGFGNTNLNDFELGDIFCGWSNDGLFRIAEGRWLGGPLNDSNSFQPLTNQDNNLKIASKGDGNSDLNVIEPGDIVYGLLDDYITFVPFGKYLGGGLQNITNYSTNPLDFTP